jgi:endo-1,4-beta-mannosidase
VTGIPTSKKEITVSEHTFNEDKRELAAKVVDRILTDASFREALKRDPDGTMNSTFPEEWQGIFESLGDPEVAGYLDQAPIEESDGNSTGCCQGGTACNQTY